MESSSSSGSYKRAKAPGNVVAQCLVDGCVADLSLCREYHRRHKVCEAHSKTAMVTIGGREQRFCQQCSRFHSLVEFDEGKRSCRKRLDGHNRRRRKPQLDTLPRDAGLLFTNQQTLAGTRLLSFSSPQSIVTSAGPIRPDNDFSLYNTRPQLNYIERQNSYPQSNKGLANQVHFMPGNNNISSIQEPVFNLTASGSSSSNVQKVYHAVDCDSALSLLSPSPLEKREFGFGNVVQPEMLPQEQQGLLQNLHYNNGGLGHYPFVQEVESKPVISDSRGRNASTLHFHEMFQNGAESSASGSSHQTLTFMWE